MCIYVYMCIYVCSYMYGCLSVCLLVFMYACTYVFMYGCIYVLLYLNICINIYIYIFIHKYKLNGIHVRQEIYVFICTFFGKCELIGKNTFGFKRINDYRQKGAFKEAAARTSKAANQHRT